MLSFAYLQVAGILCRSPLILSPVEILFNRNVGNATINEYSAAESSSRLFSSKLCIMSGSHSARCDCAIFVTFYLYRGVKWNAKLSG